MGKRKKGSEKKKNNRKAHIPGLQIATNEFSYVLCPPCPHTSGPHFTATNIKRSRENWIRAPFFIYLFFRIFSLRFFYTYALTLSIRTGTFFTPWIIHEKHAAFPLIFILRLLYRYMRLIGSAEVLCKRVTDTDWKISPCKWRIRSTTNSIEFVNVHLYTFLLEFNVEEDRNTLCRHGIVTWTWRYYVHLRFINFKIFGCHRTKISVQYVCVLEVDYESVWKLNYFI